MMKRFLATLPAALALLPQASLAHPGHAAGLAQDVLIQGFLHPLSGADHILAMTAVGLLAALRGGRALWALPLAFLSLMAAGGALGMTGAALPFVETGIALSIVAFGLAASVVRRVPLAALVGMVGAFAVLHGYAHGAEMPETASGLAYGLGFLAGTAGLHAAGLGIGLLVARTGRGAGPLAGGALALSGLVLLAGA